MSYVIGRNEFHSPSDTRARAGANFGFVILMRLLGYSILPLIAYKAISGFHAAGYTIQFLPLVIAPSGTNLTEPPHTFLGWPLVICASALLLLSAGWLIFSFIVYLIRPGLFFLFDSFGARFVNALLVGVWGSIGPASAYLLSITAASLAYSSALTWYFQLLACILLYGVLYIHLILFIQKDPISLSLFGFLVLLAVGAIFV